MASLSLNSQWYAEDSGRKRREVQMGNAPHLH